MKAKLFTPGFYITVCLYLASIANGQTINNLNNLLGPSTSGQTINKLNTLNCNYTGTLDENGTLTASVEVTFPSESIFSQILKAFPNPYVVSRQLFGFNSAMEMTESEVHYDNAKRTCVLSFKAPGTAVFKRGRWWLPTETKNTTLLRCDGDEAMFQDMGSVGNGMTINKIIKFKLPRGSSDGRLEQGGGYFTYALDRPLAKGSQNLDVILKVKPRIMAATYKIYGMREVENGTYWVAKTVITNSGTGDVVDLKVSYRLGEYSDWSTARVYNLVPAGGAIVDLYYPIINREISELRTPTPVDLEVKYSYKDSTGQQQEETSSSRVTILGINQFEFSNLPETERTAAWIDQYGNAPLLTALVTKMDDPVRALSGIVAQCSGGAGANINDDGAIAYCNVLYQVMALNGLSYITPSGFLTDFSSSGQDLKYPRDVMRDKAGTCIDLAIFYAAVCNATGLDVSLMIVPGHCYPIVHMPSGQLLVVETTMIGRNSFTDALKFGSQEYMESTSQLGRYIEVDVNNEQKKGVSSPELPQLPPSIMKDWGWKNPVSAAAEKPTQSDTNEEESNSESDYDNSQGVAIHYSDSISSDRAITLVKESLFSDNWEIDSEKNHVLRAHKALDRTWFGRVTKGDVSDAYLSISCSNNRIEIVDITHDSSNKQINRKLITRLQKIIKAKLARAR